MNIEIRTERTHLFAPNVGVAIKVEITGNPSESQLKAAIKTAVQSNAAICQKIIISQDGKAYGKKALTGMPISIRAAKNKEIGNWASGLSINYKYDNKADFSSNVKEIHKQIYAFINKASRKYFALRFVDMMDGSLLDSVCMEKYLGFSNPITHKMSELMNYNENARDLGITNLTKVSIPATYKDFSIKKLSFVAPVVPYVVRVIAIATFDNEMCITMNTVAPDKNKEQQLFNQAIDFLCSL